MRGTQRVIAGDFSHRIEVTGKDQLAELGRSFNRMTEHLEQLLVVAKEKERLESEIEIAREVQSQLFPRESPVAAHAADQSRLPAGAPGLRRLLRFRMRGRFRGRAGHRRCGGEGNFRGLADGRAAKLAAGAVADPVAVISVRPAEAARMGAGISTSRLVSNLNRQLYSTTSPKSMRPSASAFTMSRPPSSPTPTPAILSPLLVRDGAAELLDVNGTVVGAFPFSEYDESRVQLRPGDLLVFYTDGVTEPENEYGEMFGEERLIELLMRNAQRPEEDDHRDWCSKACGNGPRSEELQDDMTLLLARRV